MKELLDHLRQRTYTLTVRDYEGDERRLETLAAHLAGVGVAVRTVDTDDDDGPAALTAAGPGEAVLHRGEEVFGTVTLEELLPADGFERAMSGERPFDRGALPVDAEDVTVSPATDRSRMIAVSRRFEREALRHGDGWMRTGFQELSVLADSPRTRSVYRRLAAAGLDVAACGYPDTDVEEEFAVIPDEEGQFRDYWFLLFDGGDRDHKAALVARHDEPALYDAFWTVDADTVDDLVGMARERYPALG